MISPRSFHGGAFAAALTFFDEEGRPDWSRWGRYLAWLCNEGLDGVLVMGTTGEFSLLSPEERHEAIRMGRAAVPPGKRVLACISAMTTREAVALAATAGEVLHRGDALLAGPPYYYQKMLTPARFKAHFAAIAQASDLPLLYYHIPKMSHFDPGPALLAEAAREAPLRGMKDSDGDLTFQRNVQERCPSSEFVYFSGRPDSLLDSWNASGRIEGCGSITGIAAAMPRESAELWRLWREARPDPARDLHRRLAAVWRVTSQFGVPGCRALLELCEPAFEGQRGRAPFEACTQEERTQIDEVLSEQGFQS